MIIEIKEDKFEKMAEYTEKMLKYGGKLMSCISELEEETGMGHRGGRYGGNMGYRHEDDDEDWEMGERRGRRRRDSMGRYR